MHAFRATGAALALFGWTVACLAVARPASAADAPSFSVPAEVSDLVGEWTLTMVLPDSNPNRQIDESERAQAVTNMKDYYRFNADGTCQIHIIRADARYELTRKSNGQISLDVYAPDGTRMRKGEINKVGRDELILLSFSGGRTFSVFRRLQPGETGPTLDDE